MREDLASDEDKTVTPSLIFQAEGVKRAPAMLLCNGGARVRETLT